MEFVEFRALVLVLVLFFLVLVLSYRLGIVLVLSSYWSCLTCLNSKFVVVVELWFLYITLRYNKVVSLLIVFSG